MPGHFWQFIVNRTSPGLIVVPKDLPVRLAVEELLLIWSATQAEERSNLV